jgi:two-component system CheB/CheR fusion protein
MTSGTVPARDEELETLLAYLRDGRGFDFTGYKRTSLSRRIHKRIAEIGLSGAGEYLDHVQVHPDEVAALFDTILINVTSFFRDPDHWEWLRVHVLPPLVERLDDRPLRIWSTGCSSGEEAYTLAMLLAEAAGFDRFRESVKIYATDVDADALATARAGIYDAADLENVPEAYRERYFEPMQGRLAFRRDLRRAVVFGRHDVVQDAPISRIDLLTCRNLLMYFTSETQSQILNRLHFALDDDGYLFLGRAEMLLTRTNLFAPLDLRHRVFRKSADTVGGTARLIEPVSVGSNQVRHARLHDLAFASGPAPQVLLDSQGIVVLANAAARSAGLVHNDDFGRPIRDLEISHRPVDLLRQLEVAARDRRVLSLSNVARVDADGNVHHVDIGVHPLVDGDGTLLGMSVIFSDVTRYERLRADLQRSNSDLETAYEELQSTNEELLTTNEELQSTIEELETMNEELQSSSIEQEEVNDQLVDRERQLDQANAFLRAILGTMGSGVIVVDHELRVRVWNLTSEATWGLRADEVVGEPLASIDAGLPTDRLVEAARTCLQQQARGTGEQHLAFDGHNRIGRPVHADVQVLPLRGQDYQGLGVVLLLDVRAVGEGE